MRAAIFNGTHDVTVRDRPDPEIQHTTDAIVSVKLACVCGSDLWFYRGESKKPPGAIGHEFIGTIEEIGDSVSQLKLGDFVIAPFTYNDGTCPHCLAGWTANCANGWAFGARDIDGGQGESVRVPFADATLVKVANADRLNDEIMKSLLTLSDVMCTGHHAAVSAGAGPGRTVAVVGDGAVGLCGVLASKRLGAERVIALSRNPARQKLATEFGATDIVEERGDAAAEIVMELTDGVGVDATLECVGTGQSMDTAFAISRPGATVGTVGVPHGVVVPIGAVFNNIGLSGGVAPVRRYIPDLLDDVMDRTINPGLVFDFETDLEGTPQAYAAMDERRAIKSLIRVSVP